MLRQDLLQAPSLEPDVALCTLLAEARRCAEQGAEPEKRRFGETRNAKRGSFGEEMLRQNVQNRFKPITHNRKISQIYKHTHHFPAISRLPI